MTDCEILFFVQDAYNTITSPYMPNGEIIWGEFQRLYDFMITTNDPNIREVIFYYIGYLICNRDDIRGLLGHRPFEVGAIKFTRSVCGVICDHSGTCTNTIKSGIYIHNSKSDNPWMMTILKVFGDVLIITSKGGLLKMDFRSLWNAPQLYERICEKC